MKKIILTLGVSLMVILQSLSDAQMEPINTATKLLSSTSSLQDKARGLILAEQYDEPSVNEALVAMLNDKTPGGRISHDEGIEMPWIEAMHVLAMRFPEATVEINIDYRYTERDKTGFLKWWSENRTRIEYRGNTHVLEIDKKASERATEPSETPIATNLLDRPDGSPSAQRPQPPAPKKAPEVGPTAERPSKESASLTPWDVILILIVAAIGLAWLLLKKRK